MRAKRRAISILLFAGAKGVEVSLYKVKKALTKDHKSVLRPNELRRVENQYDRGLTLVDSLRSVAQHLWDSSRGKKAKAD